MTPVSPFWRLAEQLDIINAALIIVGVEPQSVSEYIDEWENKPEGYEAAKNALLSSIKSGSLQGQIEYEPVRGQFGEPELEQAGNILRLDQIDLRRSMVNVSALSEWLTARGFECEHIGPLRQALPNFADARSPKYAPKLAAILEAWEQTPYESNEPGTPKQRLMKWLRLNASRFGLVTEDGKPSENVIEELAKVANWAPGGGAPKINLPEPEPKPELDIPF